jgi:tRNA(Ile)-lysidine synthase
LPQDPSATRWWIALSGGLDSCVLLHALVSLKLPVKLHALHINHQISPNSTEWQDHCEAICAGLNVPFSSLKVAVKNTGKGLEDAAREARYNAFSAHLQAGDVLLLAHHADDQAETLLLRLLRGAGPRGLAAMAASRPLALGSLHRPLLHFTRCELQIYAEAQGLRWVNDESNTQDHYDRNFLRNQVLPHLRERWPAFAHKWQQTADLCAANEALIEELAAQDLNLAESKLAHIGNSISLTYVQSLTLVRRHNLIRYWLRTQGLNTPEQQHLHQIERQIIFPRQDSHTHVSWGNVSLRVYRQRLYSLPRVDLPEIVTSNCPLAPLVNLPGNFRLQAKRVAQATEPLLNPNLPHLHIRFRQGGERCRPLGRAHSQTLKHLLQEHGVEPWMRECLPLIYSDNDLVAVADLWICDGYQVTADGYELSYQRIAGVTSPRL